MSGAEPYADPNQAALVWLMACAFLAGLGIGVAAISLAQMIWRWW